MPALSFGKLARELAAAGAEPSVAARIIQELREHCADAEAAGLAGGLSPDEARNQARECLGSEQAIVAAITSRRDLLDWRHRWPHSARCVDSLAYCIALPAAPFVYCVLRPAFIVRWGLSSTLALGITGSILLGLYSLVGGLQWFVG